MMYKVSVIVPTFNHASFLPDCLDSLVCQTMEDFEIIVVDDASTDETGEVIEKYKGIFNERLIHRRMERNIGRGGVRNYGLELAKGKYITFLDSDDAYCNNKIEVQSKYLDEHPKAGGVCCQYYCVNNFLKEPKLENHLPSTFEILFGKAYSNFEEATPALMVRRDIIEQAGPFDDKVRRGQDTDMMIRLARISKIDSLNIPLYLYRQHATNSKSLKGLRERTKSNIVLYKKIIASEEDSRKNLACEFAFRRLAWHVYRLRELRYFEPIRVWLIYYYEFNHNLPFAQWLTVGLKAIVGYRLTQFVKRKVLHN